MNQDSSMSQEIPGTLKLSIWGNLIKRLFTQVRVGCRKSTKRDSVVFQQQGSALSVKGRRRGHLLEPGHGGSWRGLPAKGRGRKQKEDHPRAAGQGQRKWTCHPRLWCPASACQQPLEAREAAAISQTSPQDTEQCPRGETQVTPCPWIPEGDTDENTRATLVVFCSSVPLKICVYPVTKEIFRK